jgi:hypothetical protein
MDYRIRHNKSMYILVTILISIIAVCLIIIFVVRPLFIGYSVYQNAGDYNMSVEDYSNQLKEMESKFLVSETNLSACTNFNSQILSELNSANSNFAKCQADYALVNSDFNSCEDECNKEKSEKDKEIQDLVTESEQLKSDYEELEANSAKNICCKARVDNPNIAYYSVENNKIYCLEQGKKALSC